MTKVFDKKGIKDIAYFSDKSEPKVYKEGDPETAMEQTLWENYTGHDGNFVSGTWAASEGIWDIKFTVDEYATIFEGEVTLEDDNGKTITLKAGDTALFPAGLKARWSVDKWVKKHFTVYEYGKEFTTKGVDDIVNIKDDSPRNKYKREDVVEQSITEHYIGENTNFAFGLWDSHKGSWNVEFVRDEVCEFTAGSVKITDTDGNEITFKAGDKAIFPAGFSGTWSVDDYIEKVYISYTYPDTTVA